MHNVPRYFIEHCCTSNRFIEDSSRLHDHPMLSETTFPRQLKILSLRLRQAVIAGLMSFAMSTFVEHSLLPSSTPVEHSRPRHISSRTPTLWEWNQLPRGFWQLASPIVLLTSSPRTILVGFESRRKTLTFYVTQRHHVWRHPPEDYYVEERRLTILYFLILNLITKDSEFLGIY